MFELKMVMRRLKRPVTGGGPEKQLQAGRWSRDTALHLASNRALWDEYADIHHGSPYYDLEGFKAGDFEPLREVDLWEIGDVRRRSLLHLQCHIGLETLAWARKGARVTGVDFSPRAIELATELAKECAIPARFICADVYDLRSVLRGQFDIVYAALGVLEWLPDLLAWTRIVAHFLKPGGTFYLADFHPVANMFDHENPDQLIARHPYFPRPEPVQVSVEGTHAEPEAEVRQRVAYAWVHSMGELVTAVTEAGLSIQALHEYATAPLRTLARLEYEDPGVWRLPEAEVGEIPLVFSLRATKPRRFFRG